ncbi:tetratricopeptide repeat protein [Candidatus Woesearchaeota archaeon]|nr:tetratricopeptide repeat protein [Candidatus Woesearchaeota archaeon]
MPLNEKLDDIQDGQDGIPGSDDDYVGVLGCLHYAKLGLLTTAATVALIALSCSNGTLRAKGEQQPQQIVIKESEEDAAYRRARREHLEGDLPAAVGLYEKCTDDAHKRRVASHLLSIKTTYRTLDSLTDLTIQSLKRNAQTYREAIHDAKAAVEDAPENPSAYAALGRLQMCAGNFDAAETAYKESFELLRNAGKDDVAVRAGIIQTAIFKKDYDAAIDLAERTWNLYPWETDIAQRLIDAYNLAGRIDKARSVVSALRIQDPKNEGYIRQEASLAWYCEDYGGVIGAYAELIKRDVKDKRFLQEQIVQLQTLLKND